MKKQKEEIYSEWISRRQSVPVPQGFAEQVMSGIKNHAIISHVDLPIPYRVFASRSMQWAAAAGAVMLGLFRLSYITKAVLIP
ncbi:MAG: hypothetical protein AB9866_11600 [Syntrophobacteraceae bacterium]